MEKAEAQSILVDANLLALLAVGTTSLELVSKHKRTKAFTIDDYAFLLRLIGRKPVLIIPNVATETSNLVSYHREPERSDILLTLRRLLGSFREEYVISVAAAEQPEFHFLGLTDAAILIGGNNAEILSADAKLCIAAQKRGLRAINFNHLRDGVTV